ncbi:MAG: hypothetical protein R2695_05805 [Acidimicrobiales bacterium]
MQPFLLHIGTGGTSWACRGVTAAEVKAINSRMADGLDGVWEIVEPLIDMAVEEGTIAGP